MNLPQILCCETPQFFSPRSPSKIWFWISHKFYAVKLPNFSPYKRVNEGCVARNAFIAVVKQHKEGEIKEFHRIKFVGDSEPNFGWGGDFWGGEIGEFHSIKFMENSKPNLFFLGGWCRKSHTLLSCSHSTYSPFIEKYFLDTVGWTQTKIQFCSELNLQWARHNSLLCHRTSATRNKTL